MKKRIVLIVVLCMLTVLFAACSKEEKKDDEAVVTGTETSPTATEDGTKEAEISPTVTEEITKEPEISPAVTEEPEKNPAVTEEITEVPDENSGSNGEDDITKPADGTEENPDPDTETTPDPILTENSDELVADYYKITFLDMGYSRETVEQFLKAYENYGIFPMVIIVKEDGEASLISMGEEDEPLELKYDDRFFFSEDEDAKMLYIFKNDILTLYTSAAVSSIEIDFCSMTAEEIELYKSGYSEEDYEKAEEEAEEILLSSEPVEDGSYMSYIERSRRATDFYNYQAVVQACNIAVCNNDIISFLNEGNSYRILFTKDGVFVFLNGEEAPEDDILVEKLEDYAGDLDEMAIKAKVNKEYIIDVNSTGEVVKIAEPEYE